MQEIDVNSLIKDLRDVWKRHIQWVSLGISGILDNIYAAEFVISGLPRITETLGTILRPYYGDEIANYLVIIFTEHNKFLINLINADKQGDFREAQEQRRKWYQFTEFLGNYFESINPYWDSVTTNELFFEYYKLIEVVLVKSSNKEYGEVNQLNDAMEKLAMNIANFIAIGLIRQFGNI